MQQAIGEYRPFGDIGVVGEVVGDRYRLGPVIGSGGVATVRRAFDVRLQRDVAIKLLRAAHPELGDLGSEMRALASFNHPNLVRLLDADLDSDRPYLVMDLVDGPALAERCAEGPLDEGEVVSIGRGIARGLAYVHGRGVVHRDVKPGNILIASDGRVFLADFGIARLVEDAGITTPPVTVGTPAYLAPEQLTGARVGPPADIYSLGLVLAECLSGVRAFPGDLAEVTAARLRGGPNFAEHLDPGWKRLLRAMTSPDPHARPTATALEAALETVALSSRGGAARFAPTLVAFPAARTFASTRSRPRAAALFPAPGGVAVGGPAAAGAPAAAAAPAGAAVAAPAAAAVAAPAAVAGFGPTPDRRSPRAGGRGSLLGGGIAAVILAFGLAVGVSGVFAGGPVARSLASTSRHVSHLASHRASRPAPTSLSPYTPSASRPHATRTVVSDDDAVTRSSSNGDDTIFSHRRSASRRAHPARPVPPPPHRPHPPGAPKPGHHHHGPGHPAPPPPTVHPPAHQGPPGPPHHHPGRPATAL